MKVRINWFCKPRSKQATYEAEEIFIDQYIDFIPPIGSFVHVHEDGLVGKVGDIYIETFARIDGGPSVFIYLDAPERAVDLRPWTEMKAQGWSIEYAPKEGV